MGKLKKCTLMLLVAAICFAISPAMGSMAAAKKTTQAPSGNASKKKKTPKKGKAAVKGKKKSTAALSSKTKAAEKAKATAKKKAAKKKAAKKKATKKKASKKTAQKTKKAAKKDSKDLANGIYSIKKLAKSADPAVLKAFDEMGMVCKVDHSCPASGSLNMSTGVLTVKKCGKALYVNLGAFLYEITGMGYSAEAERVYDGECGNASFFPANTGYKNKEEAMRYYFSLCYWRYSVARKQLRKECPETAAFLGKAVKKVKNNKAKLTFGDSNAVSISSGHAIGGSLGGKNVSVSRTKAATKGK